MRRNALLITLILAASTVVAQTPAQWPTIPSRNMVVEAEGLPDHIGEDNRLWKIELGGKSNSTFGIPIIEGDRVIVIGGRGALPNVDRRSGGMMIVDLHTGKVLMEKALRGLGGGYAADAPIVEDGKLYNRMGESVVCLDLDNDAEVVWQSDAVSRWGIRRCHGPNGVGVMVGDYYWIPTCGEASEWSYNYDELTMERPWKPIVVVMEKETGKLVAMDQVLQKRYYHGQWSSLSTGKVDGRQLVFYGDGYGYVRAFAAPEKFDTSDDKIDRLEEVWYCDANPKEYRYFENGMEKPYVVWDRIRVPYDPKSSEAPCEIISTPVLYKGMLYVALARDYMYCKRSGKRAYGPGAMLCIDPSGTGDVSDTHIKWVNKDVPRTFSTPSIVDDLIFITDLAGNLHCLDAKTGEHYWKHDIQTKIWNYPQVVADGKIYLQNEAGDYYILAASKEKKVLFEGELDGRNGMATGVTNGVIVVVTPKGAAAYKGPGYVAPARTAAADE